QGSRASSDAAVPVRQGPARRCFYSAMAMELPPNPRSWTGRGRLLFEIGVQKKKGRGVLKGFKASKKCFANGSAKLNITFSEKLGGIVGMNYRSFKDDVVVIMKRKLPLIGVRTWSGIHPTIHQLIVVDMIVRTTFSICVILFYHR
uniref:Uncharacterized protein n=1 Tax=Aegilops tauschii subsp. strangulata TaxID=200361 RepID=A0A453N4S6_AEGTS